MQRFGVGRWSVVLSVVSCVLGLAGCGAGDAGAPAASIADGSSDNAAVTDAKPGGQVQAPVQLRAGDASTDTPARAVAKPARPCVVISTTLGKIRVALDPDKAPATVDNFLSNYVERKFYTDTVFHYVDKDFMIAGGGYTADLQPKETRAYLKNEADNGLKNKRGTIAMARQADLADSATSQFFINLVDNDSLDHRDTSSAENYGYCVFGEVVEGLDVVDRIAQAPVADKDAFVKTPVEPVVVQSIELVP